MVNELLKTNIKQLIPFYVPNQLHNIYSWNELEYLLNLRPFVNQRRFRIITDDNISFNWVVPHWQSDTTSCPVSMLKKELPKYVCCFEDCTRLNKNLNAIAGELEELTNFPTDAHIFFSLQANETGGFAIHKDISHNFIVQVDGITNFKVWGNREKPVDENPILDVLMHPGDVIYIPSGYWHKAISKSKRLSVSFPMFPDPSKIFEEREWLNLT